MTGPVGIGDFGYSAPGTGGGGPSPPPTLSVVQTVPFTIIGSQAVEFTTAPTAGNVILIGGANFSSENYFGDIFDNAGAQFASNPINIGGPEAEEAQIMCGLGVANRINSGSTLYTIEGGSPGHEHFCLAEISGVEGFVFPGQVANGIDETTASVTFLGPPPTGIVLLGIVCTRGTPIGGIMGPPSDPRWTAIVNGPNSVDPTGWLGYTTMATTETSVTLSIPIGASGGGFQAQWAAGIIGLI